jgi:hypothetical protein
MARRSHKIFHNMLLSPKEVLIYGLQFLGIRYSRWSESTRIREFHRHYGSSPLDLADIWYDLTIGDHLPTELKLSGNEKNEKGLKRYMMTHHWLWAYPKNSSMLASRFKCSERSCRGEPVWRWVKRIAAMKAKKIRWEHAANEEHLEIFSISDDGTDFKLQEWKHATLPRDNAGCSHKMKHAAAKYEVVLSVHRAKVVHIAGPFKGGTHDLEMFRQGGLKEKLTHLNRTLRGIRRVKLCLADRGYHSKQNDEACLFSLPNGFDSKALNNYKSRGRLRHETFNGRIKNFKCLSDTFRHGFKKHKDVFEAVVVIVQYQMDNGSPIFEV